MRATATSACGLSHAPRHTWLATWIVSGLRCSSTCTMSAASGIRRAHRPRTRAAWPSTVRTGERRTTATFVRSPPCLGEGWRAAERMSACACGNFPRGSAPRPLKSAPPSTRSALPRSSACLRVGTPLVGSRCGASKRRRASTRSRRTVTSRSTAWRRTAAAAASSAAVTTRASECGRRRGHATFRDTGFTYNHCLQLPVH
mmetsp:Transcript_43250/g.136471  ORF Transcript_43250/g.136471 Transcript_43250/m.136471 type:complete len:201 (+) Transcript_43250:573-1175(+)